MALLQLDGPVLARRVGDAVPDSLFPSPSGGGLGWGRSKSPMGQDFPHIADVAAFLQQDEELDFQYLNAISAIDFVGHFELVYHLTSFRKGHKATMRARLEGRENLVGAVGLSPVARGGLPGTGNLGLDGHSIRGSSQYEAHHAVGGL